MVTTEAFDPHRDRVRWLRRAATAAIATVALGVSGTGLAVGILAARQPDSSGDAQTSSSTTGSSSGLGSAQPDAPTQGGSHGS
jgi:hypothetical protein